MEYQDFERITVLRVRKICCEAYEKKLQKKLLKHEGVCLVEIKPEKRLVVVTGKVDPNTLVNIVARTGKHAVIVCSSKKLSHSKCCCNNGHSCCHKIEEEHKCEAYAPPPPPSFDDWCSWTWRPGYFGHANAAPFSSHPRWFAPPPPPPPDGCGLRRGSRWPGFYQHAYFH